MKTNSWQVLAQQCQYSFEDITKIDPKISDLISIGADLEITTLIGAYSKGYFPMEVGDENENKVVGWFSPLERGIIPLDKLHVTKSMKKSAKKYTCTIDKEFENVMRGCMTAPRKHGWINEAFIESYTKLFENGLAHSVEVYEGKNLVGGLYGVSFGRFFAGESMFSLKTDASKVALMKLIEHLNAEGAILLDTQWLTDHLARLGAIEIPRSKYSQLLDKALALPSMNWQ